MKRNYPRVIICEEGEKWLDLGQMWMYQNNVAELNSSIGNGDLVDIETATGRYMGTGYISLKSHITVRILSKDRNERIDAHFFKKRIQFAYDYRKSLDPDNLNNCRLVFGEADLLPGLIVDRYNEILVTQVSSYGLDLNKKMIYELLLEILRADQQEILGLYERNDIGIREKEGLVSEKGYWPEASLAYTTTTINENGIRLHIDVENGQKTGYFLDQKNNRLLLRKMAHNKSVLDCFTHTGGFALNAAFGNAGCVEAVDVSQTALNQALENAKLNHLDQRITFTKADVFDFLDHCKKGQYDIIVLDPPAFTKSRKTVSNAYSGYKKINLKAMKLLDKGGYLITCSCSRFMETANFEKMLRESASEAKLILRQVSVTQQNHDHPILWTMEETSYLKFYIFQVI